MQEELQISVLCHCCCFLAKYFALAGLSLLAQLSDRIIHFSALNSVHDRKLDKKGQWCYSGVLDNRPLLIIIRG